MEIPVPAGLTSFAGLTWSPDCMEIALAGSERPGGLYELFVLKLTDKEHTTRRIGLDALHPAWSPGGRLLAFSTFRDGNFEVYVMDKEGILRNLTRHEGYDGRPSWSPDETRISFESNRFGDLEICIVEVATGEVVNVTDHPIGHDRQPSWSPDGRKIAFASDREGKSNIYSIAIDGTGITRLTSGYDDGEPVSLSRFKGKAVLLDFWAGWCAPCIRDLPFLRRIEEKTDPGAVVFLKVSLEEEAAWRRAIDEHGIGGVHAHAGGWGADVAKAYNVNHIPSYYLVDSEGMIVERLQGVRHVDEVASKIEKSL